MNSKNSSHRSARRLVALSAAAALTLAACGGDDASDSTSTVAPAASEAPMSTDMPTDTSADTTSGVEITGAWARNSPAMATMGAAYMTIMSTNGDRLLAASVDSAIASQL